MTILDPDPAVAALNDQLTVIAAGEPAGDEDCMLLGRLAREWLFAALGRRAESAPGAHDPDIGSAASTETSFGA